MTVAALVLGIVAFMAVLKFAGAAEVASDAIRTARSAIATMAAAGLPEAEKEARVRRASGRLFRSFLLIAGIALAALGAAAAVVWAGALAGAYRMDYAVEVGTGWPFLVLSSAAAVVAWVALDRLARSRT